MIGHLSARLNKLTKPELVALMLMVYLRGDVVLEDFVKDCDLGRLQNVLADSIEVGDFTAAEICSVCLGKC